MIQRSILLLSVLAPALAYAQDPAPEGEETFTVEETDNPDATTEQPTDVAAEEEGTKGKASDKDLVLGENRASWQDIVVVIRKPFLKMNRIELIPTWQLTLNDNMIRHYGFDAQINYWLTDVLAVGVEGVYFVKQFRETFDLVASQDRRLPTLNKYKFGAALNFHYVPIYAKFAVFNKRIVHLEGFFTAGVGVTQSEVIPRDPKFDPWTNLLITPNVGFTMRVFLSRWLTLNVGIRDYVFIDKYEDVNRSMGMPGGGEVDMAKENASSKLINHIMFQAGLSFWFPMSFHYTTFR